MQITELYNREVEYWKKANIDLLGIAPVDTSLTIEEIQDSINDSCSRYWNTGYCKVVRLLNEGVLDKDFDKRVSNSYRLSLNYLNMGIDIYSKYLIGGSEKELLVGALPTPEIGLTWNINGASYTPRITATKDFNNFVCLNKDETIVLGEKWRYIKETKKFECIVKKNPFVATKEEIFNNHISIRSKEYLSYLLGEELTFNNFEIALNKVTRLDSHSTFNFRFMHIDYFEELIEHCGRYAVPTKEVLLGINTLFGDKKLRYSNLGRLIEGQLVLVNTKLSALENFRTVTNIFRSETNFTPEFIYTDAINVFDVFKTVTTSDAGRQRLLLDNVIVKNDILYIEKDNRLIPFFYDVKQENKLSCLSYSPFCNNDGPKRIMMTAKMSAQAVPLRDEIDDITNRIKASVLFADIDGITYNDTIVISESFAKKLTTFREDVLLVEKSRYIYNTCKEKISGNLIKHKLDKEEIKDLYYTQPDYVIDSWTNFIITNIEELDEYYARVHVRYEIPFRIGDKLSNLHGAKGVISNILKDSEMPKLLNKVGPNMKVGPIDIVISGFSTLRRASLGQLAEAWMYASGKEIPESEQYIKKIVEKYSKELQDYSNNSIVEYNGSQQVKPVGIINIIRLIHDAATHISISDYAGPISRRLKLGEMEKYNLIVQDNLNVMKELSIRSMHKNSSPKKNVEYLMTERKPPANLNKTLSFARTIKSFGYDILLEEKPLVESDVSDLSDSYVVNEN